jgi:hypothetical protein
MPYIGKKPADIIATAVDTTTGTFSGDIDVDGTTNLDVVDVDGAVNFAADVTFADGADIITASAGTSNFRAGVNAGNSIVSGGDANTVVGDEAGTAITTGDLNTALGYYALVTEDTGGRSTAIGAYALSVQNVDGLVYNTAVGYNAGGAITTGLQNTFVGALAGDALDDADYNVAVGANALSTDTLGSTSVAIGYGALTAQNFTSATDTNNTAVGYAAGVAVTTGVNNTLIGALAGDALDDADNNTAVGRGSLGADTLGSRATAIGFGALSSQNFTSATDNYNVAVGFNAGVLVSTGIQNTLIGSLAGDGIVEGARNTALGNRALSGAVAGSNNNTCIGMDAGTVTTGNNNTYVGAYNGSSGGCGALMTSGSNNTILGSYNGNQHGLDIRTASNTIVLSDGDGNPRLRFNSSGYALFSNDYNSSTRKAASQHVLHQTTADIAFILENSHASGPYGMYMDFSAAAPDNNSNYFIVGADTVSNRFIVYSDGDVVNHDDSYGGISDIKLKEQITDASSQWNDIKALTIRKYKFKTDVATGDSDAHWRIGVIAQEVEQAGMGGLVKDNPDLDKNTNEDLGTTTKSVKSSVLYMKAVKALQEAMTRIETLEAKVATLEGE